MDKSNQQNSEQDIQNTNEPPIYPNIDLSFEQVYDIIMSLKNFFLRETFLEILRNGEDKNRLNCAGILGIQFLLKQQKEADEFTEKLNRGEVTVGELAYFCEHRKFAIYCLLCLKAPSMFENYYHDKMVSKRLIPSQEEEKAQQMKDNLDYQFESHLRELRACNNIESQINEQYESIKKAQLKANTPGLNDKGIILQKNNNKNFIEENKQKIIKGEIPKKTQINNNVNK